MSVDWNKELPKIDLPGAPDPEPSRQEGGLRIATPIEDMMIGIVQRGLAAAADSAILLFFKNDPESGQRRMNIKISGVEDDDLVVGILMRAISFVQQQPPEHG